MGETLVYDADSPAGIEALARFCDTAGAEDGPALRRVALAERDPVCAGNAIRALGRLRAVAGDVDLLRLLHDGRENVRDQVIVALGQSGRAETIDVLEPFLRAPDAKTRILAGQAVGDLGGSKADAILKALLDERTAVRGRAAAAAREP
jgi:HEAT repeat protein